MSSELTEPTSSVLRKMNMYSQISKNIRRQFREIGRLRRVIRSLALDNFAFVHINKTGGSSINSALNLAMRHRTALEMINEMGKKRWEKRYTFTVVRNPWERVVSQFHHRVKTNQTGLGSGKVAFQDWVRFVYHEQDAFYLDKPRMFMPQVHWFSDPKGNQLVDKVCRFEDLNDDFHYVCKKIGRRVTLPHVKASKHGYYREYFNDETAEIIGRWFREDIEKLNYCF